MSDATLTVDAPQAVRLSVSEGAQASLTFGGEVFTPEVYHGAYIVTPAGNEQVLATAGMALEHDIVVQAIGSEYGLVSWDGSVLYVR